MFVVELGRAVICKLLLANFSFDSFPVIYFSEAVICRLPPINISMYFIFYCTCIYYFTVYLYFNGFNDKCLGIV